MRRIVLAAALSVAACVSSPAVDARVDHWRAFLRNDAPLGTGAADATAALQRAGLNPQRGTYIRVMDDGTRTSACRDPSAAITGREVAGVRGLYNRYDIEVTVCLAEDGRVEKHHVAAWHQGL